MAYNMMIKTKPKIFKVGDVIQVDAIFEHPMKSGQGKEKDGTPVKPHYITKVQMHYDGELINEMEMTGSVSSNPLVNFNLLVDRASAPLRVSWVDNTGEKNEKTIDLIAS